jgi:membrane protein
VQRFHRDEPAMTEDEIAQRLAISPRETREMVDMLIRARLLSRVQYEDQDTALLQPARDSAHITVQDVVTALDNIDENPLFYDQHPNLANLSACLDAFQSRKDPGTTDKLLRDIDPAKCLETASMDKA